VGSVGETAQRLTIHPDTLKYRLRRARELFSLDLDHPDDPLSCWLQLRLGRLPLEQSPE
jgi:DNA-binding PucR family transcriptional regulator